MMKQTNWRFSLWRSLWVAAALILSLLMSSQVPCQAQEVVGAITGTVLDASGAAVQDAVVKAHNVGTNLELTVHSKSNGSYSISNLPVGTYTLSFTKPGFETETHTQVLVTSDRTTTVDGALKVGAVSTTVEVTAVALMNQTDTTNGYVVDQVTIQDTPLGTGSFTQLAILAPGVHADFLGGAGSNSGLGNQAVFANGNRDTSNSFTMDGVSTNNIFNGNSTSQVGENRFLLNTGYNLGAGGTYETSTSVYDAIGQALPTPPLDAVQEISVNAAGYDASQGNNSGAHIGVITKTGTNQVHGTAWEQWQNSDMNAAPFFYNASSAITDKVPYENRNQFGATLGGPIKKDKLFYFLSYQGVRISDALSATKDVNVPLNLTNDRSAGGIVAMESNTFGKTITAAQINPAAMAILNAQLPNGQYLIPTSQITNSATATALGYDAIVQGPNSLGSVDQGIGNVDYEVNEKDRLTGKYYVQSNPTSNPFGAVGTLLGFAQQLSAGSQVGSITNNIILSPSITWEQHVGFTRQHAYAATGQDFTPSSLGITLPSGSTAFPQLDISDARISTSGTLEFGPSASFGDAGMYQNQWEGESSLHIVKGRHTIAVGMLWDHTQLNIINNNTNTDTLNFSNFTNFVEGNIKGGDAFTGSANRYYRADTAGAYVNDNFKLRSNLTLTGGLRWDFDGPFSEKYGKLTGFDAPTYAYTVSTDTITNSGLEIAGNNPGFGTSGASSSLMNKRQWGFAPRIGIAWTPKPKVTVRAGYGMYYDRGELFSYFSAGAGAGFNGPFGVTLAPPFVLPISATTGTANALSTPFGTAALPAPPGSAAAFTAYLPNLTETEKGSKYWPAGNLEGPFVYAGYDINNKLPYTQNWTLDLQYQLSNNWLFDVAYVGNYGQHEVLPIPFNMPTIATPSNPLWAGGPTEQMYSYGGTNTNTLDLEPISTSEYSGNAPVRVPYPGYDMNSVTYNAEGVSNYHALQLQVHKRMSNGLQFTAAYTYSHALDEQSGLGLFVTGNNPVIPKQNYASADFDQTHVFLVNYSYTLPSPTKNKGLGYAVNGWTLGGQTVAESGQPYSVYDFSGSVGSLYFGTDVEISNPIVPLKSGVTAAQAELQGTRGINAANPVLNASDFAPQFVAPGTNGVPPTDATGSDIYESLWGTTGRNMYRGPFQVRFDMSLAKDFPIKKDRYQLRFEIDAFNLFNHPDFDTPNNDVDFFPGYEPPPVYPPEGSLGYIQHTIGSSRFLQLGLRLFF
jgi:hypothetical protein